MRVKAISRYQRSRDVSGIPLQDLKDLVSQAEKVLWFNGSDWLDTVTAKAMMRRLNAMPEGSEVVIMGGPTARSDRRFACETSVRFNDGVVTLSTHFLY